MSRRWRLFNVAVMLGSSTVSFAAAPLPDISAASALAKHRELTSVEPHCREARGDEIVVCGRRDADRYRLPLIEYDAGDPRTETVMDQRERLQAKTVPCQQRGPYLVGCGMVGVSLSTTIGRDDIKYRPLAK